jgi:dsRNA-specific ribonuclease
MNSRERGLAPGCSYQRLEFLGDAALDLLLMAHHYVRDRHVSPGYLSEMRSVAVNNERLAQVAVELGVAHQLRHGSQALHRDVTQYTKVGAPSTTSGWHRWRWSWAWPTSFATARRRSTATSRSTPR